MGLNETDREIILAFAQNDMNVCETARQSVYHRNSINYHLDKVGRKTGLNPRKFYDLIELVKIAKGEKCLVIPCNIGDTVAVIRNYKGNGTVQVGIVSEMFFTQNMELEIVVKHIARGKWGVDVFATPEEALNKLNQRL